MRVNHLIIGSDDIQKSQDFYVGILNFKFINSFIDTGTKSEGRVLVKEQAEELELLIVPFADERLPSPQHIAFEVVSSEFDAILSRAQDKKMNIRAMPPLDCKIKGVGTTEVRGKNFERFYLLDPARVNVEIMRLC